MTIKQDGPLTDDWQGTTHLWSSETNNLVLRDKLRSQ